MPAQTCEGIELVNVWQWHPLTNEASAGTQLIRRNDELALLYEKIKIQQSALSKGQSQYRDRLNEIRVLKIKLSDLNRELSILKRSVADVNVLKREVHNLGRQLLQECTKVKALSEELENPLNVHRWCTPAEAQIQNRSSHALCCCTRILCCFHSLNLPTCGTYEHAHIQIHNHVSAGGGSLRAVIPAHSRWFKKFRRFKSGLFQRLKKW